MGARIWIGLSMMGIVTGSGILLSELFDFSFGSPIRDLVALATSLFVSFFIGFRYHKFFKPLVDFVDQFR